MNLIEALAFGGICAGVNKVLPILDNIRLSFSEGDNQLKISSNSIDIAANTTVNTEEPSLESIDVCVPANFAKILNTITDYNVVLEFDEDNFRVVYHNGSAKFPVLPTDEFPHNFDTENSNLVSKCELPAQTLKYIISSCRNFLGNDDLRPMMKAICLSFGEGGVEYCATDANRLISEKISVQNIVGEGTVLCIPKSTHRTLLSLIGDEEGCVVIKAYERFATFEIGSKTACITLAEGKFPNYRSIIESSASNKNKFTVLKDELNASMQRMTLLSNINTNTVVLDCKNDKIEISAENIDFGTRGNEEIEVKRLGENTEPVRIGFNATYLKDCLNEIVSGEVTLNLNLPSRAAVIADNDRPTKTVICMPVMIN